MPAPLHSQGITILFAGVGLGIFSRAFDLDSKAGTRTINAMDGVVEHGLYVPTVVATTKERSATIEGLCSAVPSQGLLGATGTLSFTGQGWTDPVGLCVLETFKVAGRAGEFLKINFTFRRAR